MTRDADADALVEAIERAQADRPSWLGRLARRFLVKAAPFALFSVAACVLLARTGVDLGWLLMAMFYTSPFMAVAVVVFIVHAWRQNTGLTWTGPASQVDLASEPGQPAQPALAHPVGQPGQDEPANLPARPATVTVTVLPGPVAALPQAAGQTAPIQYPTRDAEEETR